MKCAGSFKDSTIMSLSARSRRRLRCLLSLSSRRGRKEQKKKEKRTQNCRGGACPFRPCFVIRLLNINESLRAGTSPAPTAPPSRPGRGRRFELRSEEFQ